VRDFTAEVRGPDYVEGEKGKKNPLDQGHAAGRAGPSLAVRVPSQTGRSEYQTSLSMDRLMREQK